MTVFAQTPVKDEKTGQTKTKMSAFIVERKFGGVSVRKCSLNASKCIPS